MAGVKTMYIFVTNTKLSVGRKKELRKKERERDRKRVETCQSPNPELIEEEEEDTCQKLEYVLYTWLLERVHKPGPILAEA